VLAKIVATVVDGILMERKRASSLLPKSKWGWAPFEPKPKKGL
jgi:hypothetical protein